MTLLLYKLDSLKDKSTVKLFVGSNDLTISGLDSGPGLKEAMGISEYEYSLTVKKKALCELLDDVKRDWTDQELIEFFQRFADHGDCYYQIQTFFKTRNIPWVTWNWRD